MSRSRQETHQHRSLVPLPALVLCLVMVAGCSDSTSPPPEGQRLAFASDRGGTSQIFVVNEDGSNLEQLTHQEAGADATEPAWSPDGSRIAFTERYGRITRVVLMHRDGSHLSPITVTRWFIDRVGIVSARSPAWSPDAKHLALVAECNPSVYCPMGEASDLFLYLIQPDGFGGAVTDAIRGVLQAPAWSNDGRWIAYSYDTGAAGDFGITRVDPEGDEWEVLSQGCYADGVCSGQHNPHITSPTWSPDSRRLAYAVSTGGDDYRIVVKPVDAPDSLLVSLTPAGAVDSDPAWSPDGSELAFTSLVDGHWHVFIMNADGTNRRQITDGAFDDRHPTWSPTP